MSQKHDLFTGFLTYGLIKRAVDSMRLKSDVCQMYATAYIYINA
ncbi:hypothetical protein IBTHAUMO2_190025 [Nitrosopumilaceae archaeon]|nr:hypothetical protein IBTHAUMO2_190025 [Nitrosopumilaceae archaeon]